ncbi:hypothetical protein HYU07_01560 [Candidatus Woesearchaeota archaeon]|nr:hypothetical protein [Candidatus Woesearchaeota archaeon]
MPSDAFNESYLGTLTFLTNSSGNYSVLSINVTVNGSPILSVPAATLQLIAGTTNSTSINITNTGNTDVNDITLSIGGISGVGANLTAALSSSSFAISYKSSKIVNITISAPLNQAVGAYSGQISAGYRNAEKSANATLSVIVLSASRALTATAASATWVRNISTTAAANTTITNTGNLNISDITVSVPDLYNGIYMLAKSNIAASSSSITNLMPGQNANITFTLTGVTSSLPNGAYTGTINVTSVTANQTAAFTLTIRNPIYSLSAPSTATFPATARNASSSTSFTITNDGDFAITDLNVTTGASSAYNVTFSGYSTSLTIGGSTTVTVNGFIPLSEDSGSHSIGTIYIRSAQTNATNSALYVAPESKLEITRAALLVDGSEDSVSNGETGSDDMQPGSTLKVEVEVKNTFTSSEDIKLKDVFIRVTANNINDDEDEKKETSTFSLSASRKSGTKTLDFGKVSNELGEGTYAINIYAEGDDEHGATHTAEWTVYVELDKEEHDIRIYTIEGETNLSCNRKTTITPHIYNFGSSFEDEAEFAIVNTQLGLSSRERFELDNDLGDSDSRFSKDYDIDAANLSTGTYAIKMYAYHDGDDLDDERTINIVVKDCSTTTTGGQSYSIDFATTSGKVLTLKNNDVIAFSLLNEAHTITINNVGATSVTLTISSTPVTLSLSAGETRNIDLNGDGISDIAVTLHSITSGQALITTTKLAAGAATTGTATTAGEEDVTVEKPFTETAAFIIILIGAIVIVALLIIVLMVYLMKK